MTLWIKHSTICVLFQNVFLIITEPCLARRQLMAKNFYVPLEMTQVKATSYRINFHYYTLICYVDGFVLIRAISQCYTFRNGWKDTMVVISPWSGWCWPIYSPLLKLSYKVAFGLEIKWDGKELFYSSFQGLFHARVWLKGGGHPCLVFGMRQIRERIYNGLRSVRQTLNEPCMSFTLHLLPRYLPLYRLVQGHRHIGPRPSLGLAAT